MLEEMRRTLGALGGQLQTLWVGYLNDKPTGWLRDRHKAPVQLAEMRNVRQTIESIQDDINSIYQTLGSAHLKPIREKEN